jgi:predicted tellurium resistance membrane protein TerC
MDNGNQQVEPTLSTEQSISTSQESRRQRLLMIGIVLAVILVLALVILAIIYLLQPGSPTDRIRDVFIIFMALESLVLGLVLVILIVQLARLINLLQNEIKPILDSTNETVSTLRGTTEFLSDNLVEPVIKMNGYMAGLQQALKTIGLARGKKS